MGIHDANRPRENVAPGMAVDDDAQGRVAQTDPLTRLLQSGFMRKRASRLKRNPLADPLKGEGQASVDPATDRRERRIEFSPEDVQAIRARFSASQTQFASLMGISVDTLRNWEQGRRRPQGPARALLRVAAARPQTVATVLQRHRTPPLWD